MLKITSIAHAIGGLLTSLSIVVSPVLAVLSFLAFMIYELDEDWHISDEAYRDIKEYSIGLYAGILILLLTTLL